MKQTTKLKITLIGAGSMSFAPVTIKDILLNERINEVPLEICLMDISEKALVYSKKYADQAAAQLKRAAKITSTTNLETSLEGANFVVTAIELDRYYYWSQDFHIPRKYGFKQIYGENGGPGGMFHTLRNLPPMLHIARTMEKLCPDAWLINYTNPEAKIIEGITKLTKIKAVGLCHGIGMGIEQLARILEVPEEELDITGYGLNHFGWFTTIKNKITGVDLYPVLKAKEPQVPWMAKWDEITLSRIMMRTYGLYPYPGTNHIGEYIRWSDDFLASSKMQYFYDPLKEDPWATGDIPRFVYNIHAVEDIPIRPEVKVQEEVMEQGFCLNPDDLKPSHEMGVPAIEAIAFDVKKQFLAVNLPNKNKIPGLPADMVVELPAYADGEGFHTEELPALPDAITEMIRVQGIIHKLVIEAYTEKSRNKLLQAVLLDPTISSYNNAISMINEMCEVQKNILPPMFW